MPKKKRQITKNKEVTQDKAKKGKKVAVKILSERKKQDNEDTVLTNKNVVLKPRFNNEKTEQNNRLIMWVGISCVMAAFFIIWIFNLQNEFKASVKSGPGNGFNWSQTRVELDKTMQQVKQSLAQIKQIQGNAPDALSKEPALTQEQVNLLKGKLLQEVATTTASSTVENIKFKNQSVK